MSAAELFVPAWRFLLVKRDPVSEVISSAGIIGAPSTLAAHKPRTGTVVAAGPDVPAVWQPAGSLREVRVAFQVFSGHELTIEGDSSYALIPASEVMAWAVNWTGKMEDADVLEHLEPPPGCMLVERLPMDDDGKVLRTDNYQLATRSPFAEVLKVASDAIGDFNEGEVVFLSPGVSRGVGLGFVGERPILTVAPEQVLARVNVKTGEVPEVATMPNLEDPLRSLRSEAVLDERFDEGDSRAPR
jgi:co-chaperonin GroES (HSP10)